MSGRKNDDLGNGPNADHEGRSSVIIPDDFAGFPVDAFFVAQSLKNDLDRVLITGGMIKDRIQVMAYEISKHFSNKPFVVLCVLKGGYLFFSEMVESLRNMAHSHHDESSHQPLEFRVEFIRLKSYVDSCSTGNVKVFSPEVLEALKGENVLVVEDIVDSGLSMHDLVKHLKNANVRSIKIAVLMVKRNPVNTFKPDYVGFEIPNAFVVGCNLDYNEHFRNLNHVCTISEAGKKKYAIKQSS